MDIITVDPTLEQLKFVLYIAGAVITVLILIIGFFLQAQFSTLHALNKTTISLKETVVALKTQLEVQTPIVDKRLELIERSIQSHHEKILKIEAKYSNDWRSEL